MTGHPGDQVRQDRIRICNNRSRTIDFTVEPWGDVHAMGPGEAFDVVATGPSEGTLEVDASEDGIVVFGWSGSVVQVFRDGKELGGSGRPPVPSAPPGTSIKQFVGWMNQQTGPQE
jgi:hypothetical protein